MLYISTSEWVLCSTLPEGVLVFHNFSSFCLALHLFCKFLLHFDVEKRKKGETKENSFIITTKSIIIKNICHPLPFLQYSSIPHFQNSVFNKHREYFKYLKALFVIRSVNFTWEVWITGKKLNAFKTILIRSLTRPWHI